ncbi:MAG: hypothetical protein COV67_14125 [Nitrospinae bacterium CG11_big_fil_rev_8_21_14_0_20_56_8]|nr:MAG: hypothetical protein COV67_14125 [Nitrospinae bacterium CG11_big_fil_rev_8_21_14_0_20_56_8]
MPPSISTCPFPEKEPDRVSPMDAIFQNRWFHFLFRKRLTISLFVIMPLVVALTAFASGFIALVLVEYYLPGTPRSLHSESGQPVSEMVHWIRMEVLAFTLLGGLAGAGIAFAILDPLRRVIEGARQVAQGDFTRLLEIEHLDELGILGKNFNQMVDSLNRHFIDSMTAGWVVANTSGKILSINPGIMKILGCKAEDLVGQPVEQLARYLRFEGRMEDLISQAVNRQQVVSGKEFDAVTQDDRKVHLSLSTTLLKDKDDLLVGVAATLKDLTLADQLTEQIQRTDKLVALGGMAATLAHEIRNPLGSIRGLTQLLDEEFSPEDKRRTYTHTMIREIDRLNGVVSNLLNFAQPAPGERHPCDVNGLIRQVLGLAGPQLDQAAARVHEDLDPQLPPVEADDKQLVQAFLNLVLNAQEAIQPGGAIRIVTRRLPPDPGRGKGSAAAVRIQIQNDGEPIDPAILDRIYDPFFTTRKEGTGLGLSITHQIVVQAGGTISHSREGTFTVFTVDLPDAGKPAESPSSGAGKPDPSSSTLAS